MSTNNEKDQKVNEQVYGDVIVTAPDEREPHLIPTAEDIKTLRRVPAAMPLVALCMCLVEFTERASYYGTTGPFNNFINMPLPEGGNGAGAVAPGKVGEEQSAGALGMGSVSASAIVKMFTFLAYVIPILGGIVADSKWGRFKTICVGTAVGAIAHVILVIPAIPQVIVHPKAAVSTFIISIIILAFAAGFIKPSLGPMLCDQSPVKEPTIQVTKKGERVIIDPQATVERYLLIFYGCINLGALFAMATQYSARLVGFWLAFLLPGILYMLLPILLWWGSSRLVKMPPQGSVVPDTLRVLRICLKQGGWMKLGRGGDAWWGKAKPSNLALNGLAGQTVVHWDDQFVEEVRQTMNACVVFLLIPIFLLANGGMGNQLNDMSTAMILQGIPNDFLGNFNSIAIIVFTPILTYGVYPFFDRIRKPLKPMTRMCIGFLLASIGCVFAAVIQARIYATSPCGKYASKCKEHSTVSLWWQLAPIGIPAIGELMKGLVYAIALFNSAIGAAISMACSAALTDPNLVIPWIVLACLAFVCAFIFPTYFRHLNEFDFKWSEAEQAAITERERIKRNADVEMIRDDDKY